jgi:hypothetical protein
MSCSNQNARFRRAWGFRRIVRAHQRREGRNRSSACPADRSHQTFVLRNVSVRWRAAEERRQIRRRCGELDETHRLGRARDQFAPRSKRSLLAGAGSAGAEVAERTTA